MSRFTVGDAVRRGELVVDSARVAAFRALIVWTLRHAEMIETFWSGRSVQSPDAVPPQVASCSELLESHQNRPDASAGPFDRSDEHTSELQSLMRISYAVFC